jgi:hypothetical protein
MADFGLWTTDRCIDFVRKSLNAAQFSGSVNEIIESFRRHFITGSTLLRFSDENWREAVPAIGPRIHLQEAVEILKMDCERFDKI